MMNKISSCNHRAVIVAAVILLAGLLGCPPPLAPVPPPISLTQAIQRYNANAAALPAFKARIADWKIQVSDPENDEIYRHSDLLGSTYYRPELGSNNASFYLLLSTLIETHTFVIGANPQTTWLYSKLLKQGWWKNNTAASANDADTMLDVNLLLFSLGWRPLLLDLPYNYKVLPEQNIIEYRIGPTYGRSLLREVILDRRRDLPVEINHYNAQGRRILHTTLDAYKSCGDALIPTDIYIEFSPDGADFLRLHLTQPRIDTDAHGKRRNILFTRPEHIPGLDSYHEIGAP